MMRLLDITCALLGLVVLAPVFAVILFLVWRQDGHSPFYIAARAGKGGKPFRMVKIRSMIKGADKTGVESTSAGDARITPLGHFIRRYKLDELSQLWNVLKGDMSLVGPRPNTMNEVAGYTEAERHLLDVRPGITDFSSIVFSDEGDILRDAPDPGAAYSRLIWPWKCALGLLYARHAGLALNVRLVLITLLAIRNKPAALRKLQPLLARYSHDPKLLEVCRRQSPLETFAQ